MTAETFWEHVERSDGCWPWRKARTGAGYGMFYLAGRMVYAHRMAYELACGPIPCGFVVRHACDNPLCCRPEHLRLGTSADNSADMVTRGRHRCYALTPEQVLEIRTSDASATCLAARYGVSPTAVQMVRRGESYGHI